VADGGVCCVTGTAVRRKLHTYRTCNLSDCFAKQYSILVLRYLADEFLYVSVTSAFGNKRRFTLLEFRE
jgi:hypothetical protein